MPRPIPDRRRWRIVLAAVAALAGGALLFHAFAGSPHRGGPTGLFTSLPILWAESDSVGSLVRGEAPPHWARAVLSARGSVVPLDSLGRIDGLRLLLIAQPRPLGGAENVELDRWVRGGGHVLLFADPMLTAPSAFTLGDRRRPQDVVLLSPILSHWGLRLVFDEVQPLGTRKATVLGAEIPVNLPGRLELSDPSAGCTLADNGLAARCTLGKGRATIIADAALLETGDDVPAESRTQALAALLDRADGD
ncbi:MAG: ABC transporter [Sphingomonadales bacterium]|nr:ABC transporter [Sphingomonadales bacterium]